ncbi:MAG TPA: hypothetical protein VFQ77_03345 [Pseudonocardiaceae bacterium]|jgi:hypothetical protein|nr:hypothetical protein [Pseudonocardiaceae bacterium]
MKDWQIVVGTVLAGWLVGAAVGTALDQVAVWMAIGAGLGVTFGLVRVNRCRA